MLNKVKYPKSTAHSATDTELYKWLVLFKNFLRSKRLREKPNSQSSINIPTYLYYFFIWQDYNNYKKKCLKVFLYYYPL